MIVFVTIHVPAQAPNAPGVEAKASHGEDSRPAAEDRQALAAIPFFANAQFPVLVVSVSINGQEPLPFIVDTGLAQPVIIEKWAADKLKLVPSNDHVSLFPEEQDYPLATLQSLVLKGEKTSAIVELDSLTAAIGNDALLSNYGTSRLSNYGTSRLSNYGTSRLSNYGTSRIAGVLGIPIFSQLVMQIDFSQHVINLSRQQDQLQINNDALRLTLLQPTTDEQRYFASWPAQALNGTGSTRLLLDMGANTSSFPKATIFSLQPLGMSVIQTKMTGATFQSVASFIPRFPVGNYVIPNLVVTQSLPNSEVLQVSTLGMDILEHFRVTLNFPRKQMFLDKFDNKPSISAPTTTGIQLKKRGIGFFVQRVLPLSPAEKASVHVGDKVTQVDGIDLASYSVESAQQLLDGDAGADAKFIAVSADGNLRQITLLRLTLYDASLYPDYGFLPIKRLSDQAILIGYILCASPAWKAGVRAGDVITAINKTPVKTTDQARTLLKFWPQKTMTLKIRRDGKPQSMILDKTPAFH